MRLGTQTMVSSNQCSLQKDPGKPNIKRLRVIHLYEANYNLFLKLLWAQRLMRRGEKHHMFGKAQQGSQQGKMANDAVQLKRLTYDLTQIARSKLETFDNDAKLCYNRIINGIAMLAALEVSKCSYYLLYWKRTNGIPDLMTL